jgi:DNA polymerase-3 subunit epsilon
MKILTFHSATTGMIDYQARSDWQGQPHIVELAMALYDTDIKQVVRQCVVVVKPQGWVFEPGAIAVHGISEEKASAIGIAERLAAQMFLDYYQLADIRVAHSISFDNRVIRIALKRYFPDAIPDQEWKNKDLYFCTMNGTKELTNGAASRNLASVFEVITGARLPVKKTTMSDALAALEIYKQFKGLK